MFRDIRNIFCLVMLINLYACNDDKQESVATSENSTYAKIPKGKILTIFNSGGMTNYILKNNRSKYCFLVVYSQNKLRTMDTLLQSDKLFESKKEKRTYELSEKEIIVTQFQKMVHPSSNWQGQAPWYEKTIYRYPRLK